MEDGVVARRAWDGLALVVVVVLVVGVVVPLAPGEPLGARFVRGYSAASTIIALVVAAQARSSAVDHGLRRPGARRAVVAVLLALLPAVGNVALVTAQLRSGITPAAGLLTAVACVIGLGAVLALVLRPVLIEPADEEVRSAWAGRRAWVPAGVVALALAIGGSSLPRAAEAVLVSGTTAPAAVAEAELPQSLGRAAWTRELAAGTPLRDAAVVAGGLALETDDSTGVVLLDGATGEELWSFHRAGAVVDELVAALDGRLLVVVHEHRAAGPWEAARTWSLLDATTGEVLGGPRSGAPFAEEVGSRSGASKSASWGGLVLDEVALHESRGGGHTAYDVRTGAELWTCTDCTDLVAATDDAFLVTADGHVRALDHRTGKERWAAGRDGCGIAVLGVDDGVLVTRCGTSGDVVGTDTATGEGLWRTDLPDSGSYTRPVGVSHGAVNVRTTQTVPGVPRLPESVTGFDRVTEDVLTAVLDVRTGEPLVQLPAGGYASALAGDVVVVSGSVAHNAAAVWDLRSGQVTPLTESAVGEGGTNALAPSDGWLELDAPSCVDLPDGVHCRLQSDPVHVATLARDGTVSARRWSDLAVPDGLWTGPGLWTADAWEPQRLLAVPGGTVLAAAVGGGGRQVLVGLLP